MFEKVSKEDWQFLLPFVICAICFLASDVFGFLVKSKYAYWSGRLTIEPYRIITSHFIHSNANHLLANSFGIVIARYCLKKLKLKSNYFFICLIMLLIPIQILLFWLLDIYLFKNPMSLAVGFSGVIYGAESFILLASIFGKKRFLGIEICLHRNKEILNMITILIVMGILWSLLPGVSLIGHITGCLAGLILFLI